MYVIVIDEFIFSVEELKHKWWNKVALHAKIREKIFAGREKIHCCHCSRLISVEQATIEHIIPQSYGGGYDPANITVACVKCNGRRGNIDFYEYREKRRQRIKTQNAKATFVDNIETTDSYKLINTRR